MLLFFYIFVLLNLCIKAEECSIITISDTDDIVIVDSPFFGFDEAMFLGYNGCYERDTLDGYIMYFRNPDDLISPGLGVTNTPAGVKWRLNEYTRVDVNSKFERNTGTAIVHSSANDVSKNVEDITSWSISINVTCGCNFFTTFSPTSSPTPDPGSNQTIIIVVVIIIILLILGFFIVMRLKNTSLSPCMSLLIIK